MSKPDYQSADLFKKEIMNLKKQLVIKTSSTDDSTHVVAKTTLFEVPAKFWQSGIDTFVFKDFPHASIKFNDFAKNRSSFEYIKEFNKLNCYQPTYLLKNSVTGDTFQVNKGFVMGMTDDDEDD